MGMRHRYLAAFQAADKNGDGELTREELKAILLEKQIPLTEIDVSQLPSLNL